MRPLVWATWWAGAIALVPVVELFRIELGTSRRATPGHPGRETVEDTTTSHLFDAAAGVALALAAVASFLADGLLIRPRIVAWASGVALTCIAIVLSRRSRHHLGEFHRHALTSHDDHRLVSSGPYRHVRHPLYLATIIAFVGIGLVLGNWCAVAALGILPTTALVHRIRVEEQILERSLGHDYAAYANSRARLVPRVW